MLDFFIYVFLATSGFILMDFLLGSYEGKYYIVHALCNLLIVGITIGDVLVLYQNPELVAQISYSTYASIITYALHFYHIIWYIRKLRFDDWLHHILMIFIALPIATYFGSTRLLGHSLFYTTGLPGMIDYTLLFLVRNKFIDRMVEKKVNLYLNTYLRCPGCVIHLFLTILYFGRLTIWIDKLLALLTGILVYWNGVYFMDQVVGNYYIETNKLKTNIF